MDVRLSGFFTPEDARTAITDIRTAIRSLGGTVGQHVTLYDVTDVQIAPGSTVELLQQAFGEQEARELWARRVAYCTPSALARMQMARLRTVRPDIGIFADRASALAWLLSSDPSAVPDTPAA